MRKKVKIPETRPKQLISIAYNTVIFAVITAGMVTAKNTKIRIVCIIIMLAIAGVIYEKIKKLSKN